MHSPARVLLVGFVLFCLGLIGLFGGGGAVTAQGVETPWTSPTPSTPSETPLPTETTVEPPLTATQEPTAGEPSFTATDSAPALSTATETILTPEPSPTGTPTEEPTEPPTAAPTELPTETPAPSPTLTETPLATDYFTQTPTDTATETPTDVATEIPTATPTITEETPVPTDTPTPEPSATLTGAPPTEPGTVRGKVILQGRDGSAGVSITTDTGASVTLQDSKSFQLGLEPGTYVVTANLFGYLSAQSEEVAITSNETVTLGAVTLVGGDANGDGVIDLADATLVAGNFELDGVTAGDLNGDGQVNILDLVLVNSNFGLEGIQPWQKDE
jgi:hypothetical protein